MIKETRICVYCGNPTTRYKHQFKRTIENTYCSRSCSNFANHARRGLTGHHNYKHGGYGYRNRALMYYEHKCSICGYDVLQVLEVHHKDGNRKNNELNNLDVLCPTHHVEYQIGIRTYK